MISPGLMRAPVFTYVIATLVVVEINKGHGGDTPPHLGLVINLVQHPSFLSDLRQDFKLKIFFLHDCMKR